MSTFLAIAVVVMVGWLAALTYLIIAQGRELQAVLVSLKHVAGADKHVGGTGRNRRRTDFRVPVKLTGFLRVNDHARPCRVVDLSRSGVQVLPDGGRFPIGAKGLLTIDFGEFDSASSHVKIVRAIEAAGTYGLQFVDAPDNFREKCVATIRNKFREQVG